MVERSDATPETRKRVRLRVSIWQEGEKKNTGFTTDASGLGLFIECNNPPDVGTRLHLEIMVSDKPFLAEGVVHKVLRVPRAVAAVKRSGFELRFVGFGEVLGLDEAVGADSGVMTQPEWAELPVVLTDPTMFLSVYQSEICEGQLFVPTEQKLEPGQPVSVVVQPPEPEPLTSLRASVTEIFETPAGAMVKFTKDEVGVLKAVVDAVKRRGIRLDFDLTNLFRMRTVLEGEVKRGGLFIEAVYPPPLQTNVVVVIKVPPPHEPIEAKGQVVQVLDKPKGVGINLEDPDGLISALSVLFD